MAITRRRSRAASSSTPVRAPKSGPIPFVGPFPAGSTVKQILQRLFRTGEPKAKRVVGGVDSRPGSIRVGPGIRKIGDDLRQNLARGNVAPALPHIPYRRTETAEQIRARRQSSLGRSPLLIETLRRRLTGDIVGAPGVTTDDVRRVGHLAGLGIALKADERAGRTKSEVARQRIRQELEGELGFLRRAVLRTAHASEALAERLASRFGGIFDRLTKDKLSRELKGLGVGGAKTAATAPMRDEGFERTTPTQQRTMTAVSSSNVASVGWEPHEQGKKRPTLNDLGTLYVQFRNGWLYQYVNAPKWLYEGLLRANSKGKFVWAAIRRGLYPDGVPYGSAAVEGYERIK